MKIKFFLLSKNLDRIRTVSLRTNIYFVSYFDSNIFWLFSDSRIYFFIIQNSLIISKNLNNNKRLRAHSAYSETIEG